jgi:hypothetical protein
MPAVIKKRGNFLSPLINLELHLRYCDTLYRTDFNAAHASYAFARVDRVCFAIRAELIYLHRADIHALTATSAFFQVYINNKHNYLPKLFNISQQG